MNEICPRLLFIRVNPCLSVAVLILSCLAGLSVHAGDAVVIGYNSEGVWTAITYDRSSTLKGGAHYKNAAQAREAALRDLRVRAGENLARVSILADSDLTGYVAVARGTTESGKDVNVVGHGRSQAEADKKALAELNQGRATANQKIVYRYFSYGADSGAKP